MTEVYVLTSAYCGDFCVMSAHATLASAQGAAQARAGKRPLHWNETEEGREWDAYTRDGGGWGISLVPFAGD